MLFGLFAATLAHRYPQRGVGVQAQNARRELVGIVRLDADAAARVLHKPPHVTGDIRADQEGLTTGHNLVHLRRHRVACRSLAIQSHLDVTRRPQPGQALVWLEREKAHVGQSERSGLLHESRPHYSVAHDQELDVGHVSHLHSGFEEGLQVIYVANIARVRDDEFVRQSVPLAERVVFWQWLDKRRIHKIRNHRDFVRCNTFRDDVVAEGWGDDTDARRMAIHEALDLLEHCDRVPAAELPGHHRSLRIQILDVVDEWNSLGSTDQERCDTAKERAVRAQNDVVRFAREDAGKRRHPAERQVTQQAVRHALLGARGIHIQSKHIHAVVGATFGQLASILVPDAELLVMWEACQHRHLVPARLQARTQLRHQQTSRVHVGRELNDQKENPHTDGPAQLNVSVGSRSCEPGNPRGPERPYGFAESSRWPRRAGRQLARCR